MGNILTKLGSFFEAHVEKIVLVVVLVLCGWILLTRVVFTPYRVVCDGRTFSPSAIDEYIHETYVGPVVSVLESRPVTPEAKIERLNGYIADNDPVRVGIKGDISQGFAGLVADGIPVLNENLRWSVPGGQRGDKGGAGSPILLAGEQRGYTLPVIGDLWDLEVEHIRAAAYVPTVPLSEEVAYGQSETEPNDIDMVTVSASFNAASLYRRFEESFTGSQVPMEWRDKELAKPIFGAVNLQRQELLPDGSWSDWRDVPRMRIENRRQLFGIYEDVDNLPPGGMQVRRLRLSEDRTRAELLQPSAYSLASAYEQWYPPKIHREYVAEYEKMKKQEARQERDQNKDQRSTSGRRGGDTAAGGEFGYGGVDTGGGRGTRGRSSRGRGTGTQDDAFGGGDFGMGNTANTRGNRRAGGRTRPGAGADMYAGEMGGYGEMGMGTQSVFAEVMQKYNDVRLNYNKDLTGETELLVWAHDDTVEPGKRYHYRLRLGVLNPIAGTNNTSDAYAEYRNKALLWSEFSAVSDDLHIPLRQYFFAKSYREDVDSMTVEVFKYLYGYWRGETFQVKPGEIIGRVIANPEKAEEKNAMNAMAAMTMPGGMDGYGLGGAYGGMMAGIQKEAVTVNPDELDLSLRAVFLGVAKAEGWTGNSKLRETVVYNMLYTKDGVNIAHAPVGSGSWDNALQTAYADIQKQKNRKVEDFKGFNAANQMQMSPFGGEGMMEY